MNKNSSLNNVPFLPIKKEEKYLFIQYTNAQSDEEKKLIRDHIFEQNIRLVYYILKNVDIDSSEYDDLFSELCFALVQAIEKFDVTKGYRFRDYAYNTIRNCLIKYLQNQNRYHHYFCHDNNDHYITDSEPSFLYDCFTTDESIIENIIEDIEKEELMINIINCIKHKFSPKNQEIFFKYFGLNDYPKYQTKELIAEYHCSRANISHIIRKMCRYVKIKIIQYYQEENLLNYVWLFPLNYQKIYKSYYGIASEPLLSAKSLSKYYHLPLEEIYRIILEINNHLIMNGIDISILDQYPPICNNYQGALCLNKKTGKGNHNN